MKLSVQKVVKLYQSTNDGVDIFGMHLDGVKFLWLNSNRQASDYHYEQARNYISEISGIYLNDQQIRDLIVFYPRVRIYLACYDGTYDTEVREELSSMIANFLLGCDWPMYGDDVDVDVFIEALQSQAKRFGFTVGAKNV
jgi:hypothetical protein